MYEMYMSKIGSKQALGKTHAQKNYMYGRHGDAIGTTTRNRFCKCGLCLKHKPRSGMHADVLRSGGGTA
jgi:hypothetical protein